MKPASGPLLLIILVVGGWVVGRVTYIGLSGAISESGTILPLPAPLLPFGPRDPFTPVSQSTHVLALADVRHAPVPLTTHDVARTLVADGQAVCNGGTSTYVRHQLALLQTMLHPLSSANVRDFETTAEQLYGIVTAVRPAPSLSVAPTIVDRWSLSLWSFHRSNGLQFPLADQGQYGGSQSGARISYRLDRDERAVVFARFSATPQGAGSGESAVGIALRPARSIPISIMVERRQRLGGSDGRSAFAAYMAGGVNDVPVAAGFTIDAYGAAGMVGARQRDGFAEGQLRAAHEVTRAGPLRFSLGAGAWGGVQPGVSRVDIGPTLVTRFDLGQSVFPRLSVDYRQRVAGDAAPSSGVAITLAADF